MKRAKSKSKQVREAMRLCGRVRSWCGVPLRVGYPNFTRAMQNETRRVSALIRRGGIKQSSPSQPSIFLAAYVLAVVGSWELARLFLTFLAKNCEVGLSHFNRRRSMLVFFAFSERVHENTTSQEQSYVTPQQ